MKYIGPAILLLVIVTAYAILYQPAWVWALGAFTVLAVLVGIVITFIVDVKESKAEKK